MAGVAGMGRARDAQKPNDKADRRQSVHIIPLAAVRVSLQAFGGLCNRLRLAWTPNRFGLQPSRTSIRRRSKALAASTAKRFPITKSCSVRFPILAGRFRLASRLRPVRDGPRR